ncbi:MAG: topoisomerase C-terminal repeat-containing protein [Butyrivibrio sp.]|uniref:type IA DNA topoisomerase n=1 Tax=Butyrivibrio sp. TaxID=28121 RepID=UPI001B7AF072|nr:type IA DNA topoisomerase [Butyrivibrio sp.]MBP3783869.1 topoisomerase C-terminal repeat-containing protein [Butyrivibrio sp.]
MKLLITEKPSVAQQFAQALKVFGRKDGYLENNEWIITWCVGHLVSLSYPQVYNEKYAKWNLADLPFLPSEYKYEVIKNVKDQYKVVESLLNRKDVDVIYNAGDSGREGEYIQRLVFTQAGVEGKKKILRVWIDSQTEDEIRRGIREAKPESAYDNLSKAAYMRAIEDYSMGINFCRALSCKFGYEFNRKINSSKYVPITVGRVMTCVQGMIIDREEAIKNFKPTNFYKIDALCSANGESFTAHWKTDKNGKYKDKLYDESGFKSKEDADALIAMLKEDPTLTIKAVDNKPEKKNAPLLYNLAELQNECSKKFKISPDKTLEVAQALYEKKMTTYPRTDARVLSSAVAKEIDKNLEGLMDYEAISDYAEEILANDWQIGIEKKRYTDDSKITDHYAIIPTGQFEDGLSDLEKNVYELICKRFLSIFYPAAEYAKSSVELLHSSGEMFYINQKVLTAPGFLKVLGKEDEENEEASPVIAKLKAGEKVSSEYKLNAGQTKPPKRYTSGSIILAMENAGQLIEDEELRAQIKGSGIGTSATRAEVIKKLVSLGYIALDKKTQILTPTGIGYEVYYIVKDNVPSLLSPKMTASWEKGLSAIENGEITPDSYKTKLYSFVIKTVDTIKSKSAEERPETQRTEAGTCPVCGETVYETEKAFICSKYSKNDKKACKFAFSKTIAGRAFSDEEIQVLLSGGKTDVLEGFTSKSGKPFTSALGLVDGQVQFIRDTESTSLICPKCGKPMVKDEYTYSCSCGKKFFHTSYGRLITEDEMSRLFTDMVIGPIDGFKEKDTGNNLSAYLLYDGKDVITVKETISQKHITREDAMALITEGHTEELQGFISNKGTLFAAKLKLNKGKVEFEFANTKKKAKKGAKK